jgi:hypothetical protein
VIKLFNGAVSTAGIDHVRYSGKELEGYVIGLSVHQERERERERAETEGPQDIR